jgi:hypothetical protein
LYPYPFTRRPYPHPRTREIQISKISPPVHIKSIPVPVTRTRCTRRPMNPLKKKAKKNLVPVPEYPRTRGTRVPATGTGMRRVEYGFEKKNPSTRRARARHGCTWPVPAVPAGKSLHRVT